VSRSAFPVVFVAAIAAVVMLSYAALSAASARERAGDDAAPVAATLPAPPPVQSPPAKPKPKPRPDLAIVRSSVPLRARPSGRVLLHAAARTEFGSKRVMSVAARRGPWLGVVAPELPNGQLAWVNRNNPGLSLRRTAYSLHADLSGRWLELRRRGRVIRRLTVAVGRPGAETPTGRFAVTDKLSGGNYGPYYGCCVLALNGHQPNLPAGWQGGNRLAIHGTDSPGSIGAAASAGCLRAADSDLQVLMRRVPLGTPVFIRA
jgi:L,D-transpeptidase catalytic domain